MLKVNKIGILTSGGDSPGMNAAIRAVTRTAIYHHIDVVGIYAGYQGLIDKLFKPLKANDVSKIIQTGGTILKTGRGEDFRTPEGRKRAYENLLNEGIKALVVIGGDGSFQGAKTFSKEYKDISIIFLPATIDNDMNGTDYTIGFDTAVNTVVEAVDKIRDSADSHNRIFFVEVMGRYAGFIAINSGIACGAEAVFIPEIKNQAENLNSYLKKEFKRKKSSNIIIVAEGDEEGGAFKIAGKIKKDFEEFDIRVSILGYIQRGGKPSAFDRVTASKLGFHAVKALLNNHKNIMIGIINSEVMYTPFKQVTAIHRSIDPIIIEMAEILSL